VFSIVVFGCVATVTSSGRLCPYYYSGDACNFAIATGVISFIGLMIFLVADALFDNMSNVQHRKYIVFADAAFSCEIILSAILLINIIYLFIDNSSMILRISDVCMIMAIRGSFNKYW